MNKNNIKKRNSEVFNLSTRKSYKSITKNIFDGVSNLNRPAPIQGLNTPISGASKITTMTPEIASAAGLTPKNEGLATHRTTNTSSTNAAGIASGIAGALGGAASILDTTMQTAQIDDTTGIEQQMNNLTNTEFNDFSTDSLLDQFNALNYAKTDYTRDDIRGLSNGQAAMNVLSATASGASSGAAAGGWGALAGGIAGLGSSLAGYFMGNKKAREKAEELNTQAKIANRTVQQRFNNTVDIMNENMAINALKSAYAKNGGLLNINNKNIKRNIPFGWKHDLGGTLFTHGGDFSNGVSLINNGGTHEQNPYDGVPMGIAPDGKPNLVEEGEVIYNDYVFSNRLHLKEKELKRVGLPIKYKNYTFALAAEKASKESAERPNDPISKRGLENTLNKLAMIQEEQRMKKGKRGTQQMMVFGGRKYAGDENTYKALPTFLRYAPVVGSTIGALQNVFQKPDYSNSDLILNTINNLSRDRVSPKLLYNRMTYNPLDRNYYLNQLKSQAGATRQALLNSGNNAGNIMTGLLAADYNAQNAVGNTLMQMQQYNNAQRQKVAEFNRSTDQYNSQALMNAALQNAQLAKAEDEARLRSIMQIANMREAADNGLANSRTSSLTNLFDNLGFIGQENFAVNQANTNKASYYDYDTNKGTVAHKKAKNGGMLTKRNRRKK